MDKAAWQERARSLLSPIVSLLARAGVAPAAVTLSGLGIHVLCGIVIGAGHPAAGGILLLVAAACDALDGALARRTGRTSRFGAFLDSTVDRIDETVVLAGIAAYFLGRGTTVDAVWAVAVLIALAGSLITSYTRARAEGLGLECKVGIFERPERIVVTLAGLFFGYWMLVLATLVLVALSWYTVWQRVQHVRRLLQGEGPVPLPAVSAAAGTSDDVSRRLAELEASILPEPGPDVAPASPEATSAASDAPDSAAGDATDGSLDLHPPSESPPPREP
ncbi:MAG: CDP-alcohol phosphatidyltransferase family protein [Candidatus Latescibacterota bacterium]|nr:MAG: CDP-alcohol phosphatidyltransferase family protein [Candidatus Latescibacterota bacterium]